MQRELTLKIAIGVLIVGFCIWVDYTPLTPIDFNNAQSLTRKNIEGLAQKNDPNAQYLLGTFYLNGYTPAQIEKNPSEARAWFKKAADNTTPHPIATYQYALMLERSDPAEALNYNARAVKLGYPPAMLKQGTYLLKNSNKENNNLTQGLALISQAAQLEYTPAMVLLATLTYEGAGIKKDKLAAIMMMDKAIASIPKRELTQEEKEWVSIHAKWMSGLSISEQKALTTLVLTQSVANGVSEPISVGQ